MSVKDDVLARDNRHALRGEAAEIITYQRGDVTRLLSAVMERGDMASGANMRAETDAKRQKGILFLWDSSLSDFGEKPEYQDKIYDAAGHSWTVLRELLRDAGIIKIEIESGLRPVF